MINIKMLLHLAFSVSVLLPFVAEGYTGNAGSEFDINAADVYLRDYKESHVNLQQQQPVHMRVRRQSEASVDYFVTQCGYYADEPTDEPNINVKGVGLTEGSPVETVGKASRLIYLMVRFMPRTIFLKLAANSSVGVFSVNDLPFDVFDEYIDGRSCQSNCMEVCSSWCTTSDYVMRPNSPISFLWAYGNTSRTFVVENNILCPEPGFNPHVNENLLVREYGLTIMTRALDPDTVQDIETAFHASTWAGKGQPGGLRNEYEYFMKATLAWFYGVNKNSLGGMFCNSDGLTCDPEFGPTPTGVRQYIKQHDPALYGILNFIYNNNREYLNSDTRTCEW